MAEIHLEPKSLKTLKKLKKKRLFGKEKAEGISDDRLLFATDRSDSVTKERLIGR